MYNIGYCNNYNDDDNNNNYYYYNYYYYCCCCYYAFTVHMTMFSAGCRVGVGVSILKDTQIPGTNTTP